MFLQCYPMVHLLRASFIITVVICSVVLIAYINQNGSSILFIRYPINKQVGLRTSKRILIYTPFFGDKIWNFLPPLTNYTKLCRCETIGECEITYNHDLMNKSDLVIFHARNMPDLRPVHAHRPKDQLWMHFMMENAFYTPAIPHLDQYFNLTMSYRYEADVRMFYTFNSEPRKYAQLRNVTPFNYANGKTKQIAWQVSHCGRAREQLAKKLHDYGLQFESYGRCRYPFATKVNGEPNFQPYKFYFAAENQMCDEYITEKYWRSLQYNLVPIVLGGANYSDPRYAIPGSFIDVFKFSSAKKLADYLLLLDRNDTLYNQYFSWKREWTIEDIPRGSGRCNPYVCRLCEKLHSNKWKFRKNPLISRINVERECRKQTNHFRDWIQK